MSAVARARTKNTMYVRRLRIYLNAGPPTVLFGGVRKAQAFIMTTVMHHDSSNAAWHWQIDDDPKSFSKRYGEGPIGIAGEFRSESGDYSSIENVAKTRLKEQSKGFREFIDPMGDYKNLRVTLINTMPIDEKNYAIAAGLSNFSYWNDVIEAEFKKGAQAWFDHWHNGFNDAMKSGFNWDDYVKNLSATLRPID